VAQAVEHLPNKIEAWSSNSNSAKKEKKDREREEKKNEKINDHMCIWNFFAAK
jgi:hypothetical protein